MNLEITSAIFSGATYNSSTGKPLRLDSEALDELLHGRAPGAKYPTESFCIQGGAQATLWMGELVTIARETKSTLAVTFRGKSSNPVGTFANMIFRGWRVEQGKDTLGLYGYFFEHGDNANGTTEPFSIG
jgi:hypothetical protein